MANGSSLPGVSITYENGKLGLVTSTQDGVAALILDAPVPTNGQAGVPILFTGTDQLKTLGINTQSAEYNTITRFYAAAGEGATLYVIFTGKHTDLQDIGYNPISVGSDILKKLKREVRLVAWQPIFSSTSSITSAAFLNIVDGANRASIQARDQKKWFFVALIGLPLNDVADNLPDLKTLSCNRVAVCAEGFADNHSAGDVGYVLGRLAAETVQRNIGRVRSGVISMEDIYFAGQVQIEDQLNELANTLNNKAYLCFRTHIGKSGHYFVDDPTATADTDDYSSIARVRVIDKVAYLVNQIYTDEILDNILTDSNGNIEAGYARGLEKEIVSQIGSAMEGELQQIDCFVDPNQNVLSTETVNVVVSVVPFGYQKAIKVSLGFTNAKN